MHGVVEVEGRCGVSVADKAGAAVSAGTTWGSLPPRRAWRYAIGCPPPPSAGTGEVA